MAHRQAAGYDAPRERQNEYFIDKDGISREVIQADICRYLGNDALVRPGVYQNRQGYYIRAYRNLTSEMIADLQADSARWEEDVARRQQQGYPRATYDASTIHESRQQTGPSAAYSAAPGQTFHEAYSAPQTYSSTAAPVYPSQAPGYGSVPAPYASAPNPYGHNQSPPPVSSADPHGAYTYASGGYQYSDARAPRYTGPGGYENESEYAPVVTSAGAYPPASAPDPRIPVDPRYSAESYPDHRAQAGRAQPPRDRDPHARRR